MFTGLIQTVGTVRQLDRQGQSAQLRIRSSLAQHDLCLGESIAVNGVCLTVVAWDSECFSVDVSPETLERSTLGQLLPNHQVNLERALRLTDRLGGHLVSGHIDCVGTVHRRYQDQNAVRIDITVPRESMRYVVEKGSVAIDGISLTVNHIENKSFSVAIIPHSLTMTTLKNCREGTRVNVETDLIGRYVERLLEWRGEGRKDPDGGALDLDFLAKNGFL